jgi:hypothetical protein
VKGAAPVKILGNGELTKKLSFQVAAVSASAKEKIEKAGGDVSLRPPKKGAAGDAVKADGEVNG